MSPRNHREHYEQAALFQWARSQERMYPDLRRMYAIPNSARRSPRSGKWLKDEGLHAGVWDIHLAKPIPPWAGMWVECKIAPNKLTPAQERFQEILGIDYYWYVCTGSWTQAQEQILRYLNHLLF
jgi:hypothetical protein